MIKVAKNRSRIRFTFTVLAAFLSQSAISSSEIPALASYSVNQEQSDKLEIQLVGSNFGAKTQAPPVLWVFGSDVRENGRQIIDYPFSFGQKVGTSAPQIWSSVGENVTYSSETRYPGLDHSYFVGNVGAVKDPLAFGGESPFYSDKTYLSARIKPVEAWHSFRSIGFSNLQGTFDTGESRYEAGESVTLIHADGSQKMPGKIVHINHSLGLVTLNPSGSWTKSDFNNAKVVGDSTGSSLVLSSDESYATATGSKYLRMWSGSKSGLYNTMSTNRLISGYRDSNGETIAQPQKETGEWDKGYGIPDLTSKSGWRLLETYIDQSTNEINIYIDIDNINRRYLDPITVPEGQKFLDRSPTISQLGLDAAGGTETIDAALNFGEIYFDTTPQRIMLSNQATYDQAGSDLELQYPTQWSDNYLEFELRTGSLDINKPVFVYVFNADSIPNQQGFEICLSCQLAAPAPIDLDIK